jgi:hypothetical protein
MVKPYHPAVRHKMIIEDWLQNILRQIDNIRWAERQALNYRTRIIAYKR